MKEPFAEDRIGKAMLWFNLKLFSLGANNFLFKSSLLKGN